MTLTWGGVVLLTQVLGAEESAADARPSASTAEAVLPALPAATAEDGLWHSLLRLEASTLALLPQGGGGEQEG
ncbi:hypothetical protein [Stigmatella aurantiaca]|uniref:Uncharacterized protein n=1 Tax=Stigmatella aurantiaca (strain DW4/3-1) TaxID=378806 RepID=E3FEZ9_STIAD|nr:hypothetical protein [Stigmatella aurantiaca]ADO70180.1 uncharacterized protein STAUR_2376 [Stigmatella aurantiaca DW4/3-1]